MTDDKAVDLLLEPPHRSQLSFRVAGHPRPGGSKRGFIIPGQNRVAMVKAGGQNEINWRQGVKHAAIEAMNGRDPFLGPLEIEYTFFMLRPKAHSYTGKRRNGELRDNAPKYHITTPDLTKLIRSTEDAMTAIVFRDDSQVAVAHASKLYSDDGKLGVQITVYYESQKYPQGDRRCYWHNTPDCHANGVYAKESCAGVDHCPVTRVREKDMAGLDDVE